jgi:hypothetical protein
MTLELWREFLELLVQRFLSFVFGVIQEVVGNKKFSKKIHIMDERYFILT